MNKRRQRRLLRRQIFREARDYCEECPGCSSDDLKEHLEDEFGFIDTIDWSAVLALIVQIVELISSLRSRRATAAA